MGPGNLLACKAVLVLIPDGGLKGLENIQKKLLAKEPNGLVTVPETASLLF